jgi:transposase
VPPLIASAIVATVPDPSVFRSGREFAAWLGLVPRQHSTGGKERLGRISRQGNRSIRQLLIVGAHSALLRPAQGCGSARQQDRAHRLGDDVKGRNLPPDSPGMSRAK